MQTFLDPCSCPRWAASTVSCEVLQTFSDCAIFSASELSCYPSESINSLHSIMVRLYMSTKAMAGGIWRKWFRFKRWYASSPYTRLYRVSIYIQHTESIRNQTVQGHQTGCDLVGWHQMANRIFLPRLPRLQQTQFHHWFRYYTPPSNEVFRPFPKHWPIWPLVQQRGAISIPGFLGCT